MTNTNLRFIQFKQLTRMNESFLVILSKDRIKSIVEQFILEQYGKDAVKKLDDIDIREIIFRITYDVDKIVIEPTATMQGVIS